jgi:hypothetical protein
MHVHTEFSDMLIISWLLYRKFNMDTEIDAQTIASKYIIQIIVHCLHE